LPICHADEDIRSLKSLILFGILLTLLHLGIKNILIGPTLPAFVSPNVLNYLVENYGIAPISTPEEDLAKIIGPSCQTEKY
jgi:hydroxylamine reductase (hybrid-cluster protein)